MHIIPCIKIARENAYLNMFEIFKYLGPHKREILTNLELVLDLQSMGHLNSKQETQVQISVRYVMLFWILSSKIIINFEISFILWEQYMFYTSYFFLVQFLKCYEPKCLGSTMDNYIRKFSMWICPEVGSISFVSNIC